MLGFSYIINTDYPRKERFKALQCNEYALITGVNIPELFKDEDKENNTHDDIWIGDTGATCHMTNPTIGLWDVKPYEGIVDGATGTKTMVTHVGTTKGKVL